MKSSTTSQTPVKKSLTLANAAKIAKLNLSLVSQQSSSEPTVSNGQKFQFDIYVKSVELQVPSPVYVFVQI